MSTENERGRTPIATYFPLVLVVCALAAGITADRGLSIAIAVWLTAACLGWAAWLLLWLWRRERTASWLLLFAVLGVGGAWHHAWWRLYPEDEISRMVQEESRPSFVEAIAITSPRWIPAAPSTPLATIPPRERNEMLVWVTAIRDGQAMRPASGWAELFVHGSLDEVWAGDRLRVYAQASRPAAPLNPGEFDFAAHERARMLGCRLFADFPECVERIRRGKAWSPRRWLGDVRSGGSALLRRYIAPERATLASAILLGTREQLDPERNEDYLVTGTIHALSISGLHVGILAAGFFFVLHTGLVSRRAALLATIGLTVAYAALTDLQPPVVRASILVVVACLALWSGRSSLGFNALAAAAIVVLAMNPASMFLAGPQLSFLAVATMIAFRPVLAPQPIADPLDRLIASTRPTWQRVLRRTGDGLWRLWLTGALIWLVSTPLVWRQYNLISPAALILNFLMWLPVTLAMYSGMATLVLGGIAPLAGKLFGLTCDGCLSLLEEMIAAGRDWPASHFWLAPPPMWWIGAFYVTVGVACVIPRLRPPRRWMVALAVMWAAVALVLSGQDGRSMTPRGVRPLSCHFAAVGHGVCVLVELPDGRNLLYDCGRLGPPLSGVRPISAVLWSRRISHLDAVVVSHADADHFNALPDLLERFSVGVIYVSPVMFDELPPAVKALRDAIERSGVSVREIYGGQRLAAACDTTIDVLHPPRNGVRGSDNANSIVVAIEHAGRRVLLTGDLESPGLEDVLAEEPLACDVVLAPHHGSPRSSPGKFAEWCRPKHVVISGRPGLGDHAIVEAVKDSFRLRGAEVYHTAEDGCVRFEVDAAGVRVFTHRRHVRVMLAGQPAGNLLQSE